MQQQKQIIEYWFETNLFDAAVCVKIKMMERDETKAKKLFVEMFYPVRSCRITEKPASGEKYLLVNELWEL